MSDEFYIELTKDEIETLLSGLEWILDSSTNNNMIEKAESLIDKLMELDK